MPRDVGSSSSAAAPPAPTGELSRREREEIEKQKKQANYQKLHAQGKTEQARADLARLAIIKQQREEAARQRELKKIEAEKKAKGEK
ncbi:CLUMA_CG005674, isoform A [Clunio marinus]|uniref:CLUMA_CG005674, isoform A n=1 Tax=Clunio marinus TaxID=568069 RepID=A0A1J1HVN2_9DIPT|nr:CLUMA_CG005674, isoform A [Clunio marinus]